MKITIINSTGHEVHGWFTSPSDLKVGVEVLEKAGIEVMTTEVESLVQLNRILDTVTSDTLIWANAYFVNDGDKLVWLNDCIEAHNLPYIGSSAKTLREVLIKGKCQSILKNHQIPIPNYCVVDSAQVLELEDLIYENDIKHPFVLKPTAESGSIGVCKAENLKEAKDYTYQILKDFPKSSVILEEFLPSDDVTCGFMQIGDEYLLLPSYYLVQSMPGKHHILSLKERLLPWDGVDKLHSPIRERNILEQLAEFVPQIIDVFNIKGITRVDGRLDKNGQLRFFDINGLPGLGLSEGVMIRQCLACFPDYSDMEVYEGFLNTIVYDALLRNSFEVPLAVKAHNFFTMKSDFVLKGTRQKKEKEVPIKLNS